MRTPLTVRNKFRLCGDATENRDRVQSRVGLACESADRLGFFLHTTKNKTTP